VNDPVETARVDRWLWAVRLYKTRAAATAACRAGHVRIDGASAKPATPVRIGQRVEAMAAGRSRVLEVVQVIDKRVGASVAAECIADHSPPAPERAPGPPLATRDAGSGRPTKRERRRLDRFRAG